MKACEELEMGGGPLSGCRRTIFTAAIDLGWLEENRPSKDTLSQLAGRFSVAKKLLVYILL